MKRTVVILGVAAAMAIAPAAASAGASSQSVKPAFAKTSSSSPQRAARLPAFERSLQIASDSRSGRTVYRLGNTGLWME